MQRWTHAALAAFALVAAAPAEARAATTDIATKLFPIDVGNTWTFTDGTHTHEIHVASGSKGIFQLDGFAGANFQVYVNPPSPLLHTRMYSWNAGTKTWAPFLEFDAAGRKAGWSFDLTAKTGDEYLASAGRDDFTVATRAGIFDDCREIELEFNMTVPGSSIPGPIISAIVFAPGVGPVLYRMSNGVVWELQSASLSSGAKYSASTMPKDARTVGVKALQKQLFQAIIGLDFTSESDYPFEVALAGNIPARAPTTAKIVTDFGFPGGSPSEEIPIATLFDQLTGPNSTLDPAWQAQNAALLALLQKDLTGLRVVRVGTQRDPSTGSLQGTIAVLIVGRDAWGDLIGVITYSVET